MQDLEVVSVLQNYVAPLVLVICLAVGYIAKKWVKDLENKYIPTIVAVVGIITSVWVSGTLTPNVVAVGLISGLASTGLHQLVTRWIEKQEVGKNEK